MINLTVRATNIRCYITLITILFTTIVGCGKQIEQTKVTVNQGDNKMTTWHLGRIGFELPEQFQLTARGQQIYHVNITVISAGSQSAEQHWLSTLSEIQHSGEQAHLIKEGILMPGVPSLFYHEKSTLPIEISMVAQKMIGDAVITATFQGKQGYEEDIARLVSYVLDSYQTGYETGFSIGPGVITTKPSRSEHATATFDDPVTDIELSIETQTAGVRLAEEPLADIEEEIAAFSSEDFEMKVLKHKNRIVGGFQGVEGIISFGDTNKEATLRYTWFTPGTTADSFAPEISIKAVALEKESKVFEQHWTALLDSLVLRR